MIEHQVDLVLNHFHTPDYIFIMTPWESLLESNNGSSIIKQLVLIAFFILVYIYIYIYIYIFKILTRKKEGRFVTTTFVFLLFKSHQIINQKRCYKKMWYKKPENINQMFFIPRIIFVRNAQNIYVIVAEWKNLFLDYTHYFF